MDEQDRTLQSLRTAPVARPGGQRARLVVLAGDRPGRKLPVESALHLGRSSSSDLHIDDVQASRRHARIDRSSGGYFLLEDLGSRNGTRVNGEPVKGSVALAFGDRIEVGETVVLFAHHDPLEEQLVERQKLEAIGRLGTGIAHDFNNLLGAITASLDFLGELDGGTRIDDDDVRACLDDVRHAGDRAAELTRRLLGFARRTHRRPASVNLSRLVDELHGLLSRTFDRAIAIELDAAPAVRVLGDRGQLHQLLMNLAINARDAMAEGGTLRLVLRHATEADLAALPYRDRDAYVLLEVHDTGVGMDEETRKRIFEPFFTTKSPEGGAGLGLATVYEVIDTHGGHVQVESAKGAGTTFRIWLPTGTREEGVTTDTADHVVHLMRWDRTHTLRVLLVDDEALMRRSARRLLVQFGHSVDEASDGLEALERFRNSTPPPDAVVLDINMPRLGGVETFERLRALDATLPVIFASGYLEPDLERRLLEAGALAVLEKPFKIEVMRGLLAAVVPRAERGDER
ncbi:MAG: ATP-binding protein [Myxococcota bacterium]